MYYTFFSACFSDGGSDSSVSDGLPVHLQYQMDKLPKKKRLKSRKERDKKQAEKKLQATAITNVSGKKSNDKELPYSVFLQHFIFIRL